MAAHPLHSSKLASPTDADKLKEHCQSFDKLMTFDAKHAVQNASVVGAVPQYVFQVNYAMPHSVLVFERMPVTHNSELSPDQVMTSCLPVGEWGACAHVGWQALPLVAAGAVQHRKCCWHTFHAILTDIHDDFLQVMVTGSLTRPNFPALVKPHLRNLTVPWPPCCCVPFVPAGYLDAARLMHQPSSRFTEFSRLNGRSFPPPSPGGTALPLCTGNLEAAGLLRQPSCRMFVHCSCLFYLHLMLPFFCTCRQPGGGWSAVSAWR
jgi:hypothetical protein